MVQGSLLLVREHLSDHCLTLLLGSIMLQFFVENWGDALFVHIENTCLNWAVDRDSTCFLDAISGFFPFRLRVFSFSWSFSDWGWGVLLFAGTDLLLFKLSHGLHLVIILKLVSINSSTGSAWVIASYNVKNGWSLTFHLISNRQSDAAHSPSICTGSQTMEYFNIISHSPTSLLAALVIDYKVFVHI